LLPAEQAAHFQNESLADFSKEESRQQMQDALAAVRKQLGQSLPLVIKGKKITTTETIDSINPSHLREIVGKCGKASKQHAEQASVIAAKLMDIYEEAGLPPGVVNYLPGIGEEIGPTLAEHPDVALVAFTGSRGVGMLLNRQTALLAPGQSHIKRLIAE